VCGSGELTSAMDQTKFSSFDITIVSSTTGGTWNAETLYTSATGTTTLASLNGFT